MVSLIVICFYISLFAYLSYVVYFIVGWLNTKTYLAELKFKRYPSISIIIPVRNEEAHIAQLLKDIEAQSYPSEFVEVLVIDDDSSDRTVAIIEELNFKNVKVLPLKIENEIVAYKKRAISLGVANSRAELIITTDGDCRMSENWISTIVDFYLREEKQLISAPVSYHFEKSMFEKVQTIEFQYLIGASAACIQNKFPNTCNGANMIYTRELFNSINGYEGIDSKASGDDEMLLHKIYKKDPNLIGFLKNKDATVLTYAKDNFNGFVQQRIRWASNGSDYTDKRTKRMLISIFLINLSILVSSILAFYDQRFFQFLKFAIPLKFLFDGLFIFLTLIFFERLRLWPYVIIVLILYTPYIVIVGLLGNFSKTYNWKGRMVK